MIKLRFVKRNNDYLHVDGVSENEKAYVGVFNNGGLQVREIGTDEFASYDEEIVELNMNDDETKRFYEETAKHIGSPWGIVSKGANDCSGFQTWMLLKCGYIEISPNDLYKILKDKNKIV